VKIAAAVVVKFVCERRYIQAPYYGTVNQTGSLKTGLALRTARPVNRLTVNIPKYNKHEWPVGTVAQQLRVGTSIKQWLFTFQASL